MPKKTTKKKAKPEFPRMHNGDLHDLMDQWLEGKKGSRMQVNMSDGAFVMVVL